MNDCVPKDRIDVSLHISDFDPSSDTGQLVVSEMLNLVNHKSTGQTLPDVFRELVDEDLKFWYLSAAAAAKAILISPAWFATASGETPLGYAGGSWLSAKHLNSPYPLLSQWQ
eukprot:Filipodium_phascolosomae@DN8327_c0_g1_i1.p1